MAEGVGLFFTTASQQLIAATAEKVARRVPATEASPHDEWVYPTGPGQNTVRLYSYDSPSLLNGLAPGQVERLTEALGRRPTTCWAIELGPSAGPKAVNDAVELALLLLREHQGVALDGFANDSGGEFLTAAQIQAGKTGERPGFLESLREHITPLFIVGLLGVGCVSPLENAPTRDNSPVQTDSLVYHLKRLPSEYRAVVAATYTNQTPSPVYFARCNRESTTPMFGVRRTGPDSAKPLFLDWAWACVGGVPTGEIKPGASITVHAFVGSVDQPAMRPPLTPEQLVGLMRVTLQLCRNFSADSDYCEAVPDAERSSNAFLVTY